MNKLNIETKFSKTYDNCDPNRESIKRYDRETRKYLEPVCDYTLPRDLDFILGPHVFAEFNIPGNNKIAIFGERHSIDYEAYLELTQYESLPFSSFLKSLLIATPEITYDFFLELDYIDSINRFRNMVCDDSGKMIQLIETDLYGCFQFVKNCPYPNLKAHYIDYRVNWKKEYLYKELYPLLILKNELRKNPGLVIYSEGHKILQNPVKLYAEQYAFIKNEINNNIIAKELLRNPYAGKIKKFIYEKLNLAKRSFKLFFKKNATKLNFIKNNDVMAVECKEILPALALEFVYTARLIMDIYCLARLTRKTLSDISQASRTIVYSGAEHAKTYIEFFNYIRAELVYSSDLDPEKFGGSGTHSLFPGVYCSNETKALSFLFDSP